MAAFCRFEVGVYLKHICLYVWLICFAFPVVDFIVLVVILIFQDVSGWKIAKNTEQAQKGNFSLYAGKTIMAMSVAFLFLCGCGSLMERNSTASGEYHEK